MADMTDGMTQPARDAQAFEPYLQHQAGTNGCGTTGMAMILSFWQGRPGAFDRAQIDARIRCGPDALAFTSPNHLVRYGRGQGFRCRGINHGSWDRLLGLLDQGVPVLVLYDPPGDGHDMLLHYVVVVGYTESPAGEVSHLTIADPATGRLAGLRRTDFEARWHDLRLLGVSTGLSEVMIVVLPDTNTPVRHRMGTLGMTDDIHLPEGDLGVSSVVAELVSDAVNALNPVQGIKNAWSKFF
ncbi:MAG: C39 family peptidase [Candidatus Sericytochromatia bacterium]